MKIDEAMIKLRTLQAAIFDPEKNKNDLFAMTNQIMNDLEQVSRDIKNKEGVDDGK
jgi:hypothetical protein